MFSLSSFKFIPLLQVMSERGTQFLFLSAGRYRYWAI